MAAGILMTGARIAALILATAGLSATAAPALASAEGVPVYAETPSDSLARNIRILADSPKDFNALIGAGRAALRLGDAQAAAGFFGRAEEVNSNSPVALAGMGAALVAIGDPSGALTYFSRAQRLGATAASIGCDRGLAYDLLGNQVAAQSDYRAALRGTDRDEARRRLALSLAISGDTKLALETLQPLIQRRDPAAARARVLVLALSGDMASANEALAYSMPGSAARMDPFLRRLPALSKVQKAAAVHLGIFPENGVQVAAVTTARSGQREDRLNSIDQLLAQRDDPPAAAPVAHYARSAPAPTSVRQTRPVRVASVNTSNIRRTSPNNDLIATKRVASDPGGSKIWLQLASGTNSNAFPAEFRRIRSREPKLFTGITGYVADAGSRSRLVIGPFHSPGDAKMFAEALESARIDSMRWTSEPGQVVRKLPAQ
ncbi:MAG TPA: hypothetical protein VFP53_01415 [Sphingomicrobium sp.]|nr:hypothetical protein [Sphingomicrobium sp.]